MSIKPENENAAIIDLLVELNVRLKSIDTKLLDILTTEVSLSAKAQIALEIEQQNDAYRKEVVSSLKWNYE